MPTRLMAPDYVGFARLTWVFDGLVVVRVPARFGERVTSACPSRSRARRFANRRSESTKTHHAYRPPIQRRLIRRLREEPTSRAHRGRGTARASADVVATFARAHPSSSGLAARASDMPIVGRATDVLAVRARARRAPATRATTRTSTVHQRYRSRATSRGWFLVGPRASAATSSAGSIRGTCAVPGTNDCP